MPFVPIPPALQHLRRRFGALGFGGPDLAARMALLIFGIAALTAARTTSFIFSVPDRQIPPLRPLIWLFHQADILFLPGANRLPGMTAVLYVQCLALALAIGLFFLATRATLPALIRRWHRPLVLAALLPTVVLQLVALQGVLPYPLALQQAHHYANDAVSATSCAIDDFLAGKNPYSSFRVVDCLASNYMFGDKTTPLQTCIFKSVRIYPSREALRHQFGRDVARRIANPCEFESRFNYPAAAFLLPALPAFLHLRDLSIVFLLCYLGMVALVLWRARGPARIMVLVVAGANAALWPTMAAGASDGLYALLVLVAWMLRDRRWLSAVALGLAVASRQQAWFYLLFYAVLVERTQGRRELLWRLGIVTGVFALCDLPFILTAPHSWLEGLLGPIRDPMFARGTGLIALSLGGAGSLPLGPRWLYGALEALVLLASVAYYYSTCRRHPGTGLILAPLALFVAWRSLYSYFLPLSLLALYPALVEHTRPPETTSVEEPELTDRPTPAAA